MPDTTPMRERLARIVWASEIVANSDFSEVPFEHLINRPRHSGLKESVYRTVDAILSELEKPTPEMVKAMRDRLGGDGELEDLFTAAIRAAKETK